MERRLPEPTPADSAFKWLSLLWPILVVVTAFASMQATRDAELEFIKKAVADLKADIKGVPTTMSDVLAQIRGITVEMKQEARVTELERASLRNEIIAEISTMQSDIATIQGNQSRIWPRLRALNINQGLLKQAIERTHEGLELNLPLPEKY